MTTPGQPELHRDALTAFVFAILGWTALPLVGPLLALYFARGALQDIDALPEDYTGAQMARAARVIAATWFALVALGVLLFLLIVVPMLRR